MSVPDIARLEQIANLNGIAAMPVPSMSSRCVRQSGIADVNTEHDVASGAHACVSLVSWRRTKGVLPELDYCLLLLEPSLLRRQHLIAPPYPPLCFFRPADRAIPAWQYLHHTPAPSQPEAASAPSCVMLSHRPELLASDHSEFRFARSLPAALSLSPSLSALPRQLQRHLSYRFHLRELPNLLFVLQHRSCREYPQPT